MAASVPVISLRDPDCGRLVGRACEEWGRFVLVDTGVPDELMERVLQLGHAFFALPLETTAKYDLRKHGDKWRDYMPLFGEPSLNGKQPRYKEGLCIGDDHSPTSALVLGGVSTFGTNEFPDKELPAMRETFTEYQACMRELGDRMMRVLSAGLGLESAAIEQAVTLGEPVVLLRMLHYAPQPDVQQQQQQQQHEPRWGIGRHSDHGLWTMLLSDQPGLELEHPVSKTWHPVPFEPHSIVMSVGNVLDRLSAGRYVSAYHRARNVSSSTARLSLPFSYDPAWTAKMATLPVSETASGALDTAARDERWAKTNIACDFDGNVEYSEFLAKEVTKVFPELVPEAFWSSLRSTTCPSTRHALVVPMPDRSLVDKVKVRVAAFYAANPQIKQSHGLGHVTAVHDHAVRAIAACSPPLDSKTAMEVQCAALLHDVDDKKYFAQHMHHAEKICAEAAIPAASVERVLQMIEWVSCSSNGNAVPPEVSAAAAYHLLIPRWADRLEAVGAIGVVRCYQYNCEAGAPMSSANTPRPTTTDQVWAAATPERFARYLSSGGASDSMLDHYYDKLLHVARPPKDIVRNTYLEAKGEEAARELVEMCLRYGKSGHVDLAYVDNLAATLEAKKEGTTH